MREESQSLLPQRILSNTILPVLSLRSPASLNRFFLSESFPTHGDGYGYPIGVGVSIASSSANPFQRTGRRAWRVCRWSLNRFFLSESFPT